MTITGDLDVILDDEADETTGTIGHPRRQCRCLHP